MTLLTNYPLRDDVLFERQTYYSVQFEADPNSPTDPSTVFGDVLFRLSGSFHFYYITEDNGETVGSLYCVVDPALTVGPDNQPLPLDCIQCQTVLSKNLGTFDTWKSRLIVAPKSGYNMIHFTPVQELGSSNSAYSLQDQLKLNTNFSANTNKCKQWQYLNFKFFRN